MAWTLGLALVTLILAGMLFRAYRSDLRAARARVLTDSSMIETACGPIEYGALGRGAPILVLHGMGGGWDQGLFAAGGLVAQRFRLIAPSRFGYLRTPLPADASPEAEAETWVGLLDALQIEHVPVVAFSAGAAPAVQLALRHPERVSALVLLVTDRPPRPSAGPPPVVLDLAYRFDFAAWVLARVAPQLLQRLLAVPVSSFPSTDPGGQDAISMMLPVSSRRLGALNDAMTPQALTTLPLDRVQVPKLLLRSSDDVLWSATSSFFEREALQGMLGATAH